MGMHHGFVAAPVGWTTFVSHLAPFAGEYTDEGPIGELSDEVLSLNQGDVLVVGSYRGASYILDKLMVLSCGGYDHIARFSAALNSPVVAFAGETVSGTYNLCVAERGEVRRVYHNCISGLQRPFTYGEPLPSESDLEDLDGNGLLAVAGAYGLDPIGWLEHGDKRLLFMNDEDDSASSEGPVDARFDEHWEVHQLPKTGSGMWKTKVVTRRMPDGGTGFDIVPDMAPSIGERLKKFFRF